MPARITRLLALLDTLGQLSDAALATGDLDECDRLGARRHAISRELARITE